MVTNDVTLSNNEADVIIWPGLESAITDGDVVTFKSSTLSTRLERLVVDVVAARAGMSQFANAINKGGQGAYSRYERRLGFVLAELGSGQKPETRLSWPKD